MAIEDLGRPYDADFQRLQGPDGASLFPKAQKPVSTRQAGMEHQFVSADDEETLRANASAWTLSAAAAVSSKRRFASYRAYQIERVDAVDDTSKMRRAPNNAVYYPWRIYIGRRYEVVFEGDENQFDASARAELGVFGGSVEDFSRRYQIKSRTVALGLKPRNDSAIFAKDASSIEKAYAQHESPVPILVEWRLIPGRVANTTSITWRGRKKGCRGQPGCEPCMTWAFTSVEYTAPGRKRGGNAWDADGSAPDLVLQLRALDTNATRSSSKFQDSQRATWLLESPATVASGSRIQLRVTDVDWMAHDDVDNLTADVPSELPRGRLLLPGGAAILSGRCVDHGPPVQAGAPPAFAP